MKHKAEKTHSLIFYDGDIAVVSKNHGVYAIPDRYGREEITLAQAVAADFGKVYTVHRLDAGTGGLTVFARNPEAHKNLCLQFQNRKVEKRYAAIVSGSLFCQTLKLPIAFGGKGRYKINFKSGKEAVTSFIPLETKRGFSLIKAIPLTGRPHQIRVHLKALKAPLYKDFLYNPPSEDKMLSLFSFFLSFSHPSTGKRIDFTATMSSFMENIAQSLELSLKNVYL